MITALRIFVVKIILPRRSAHSCVSALLTDTPASVWLHPPSAQPAAVVVVCDALQRIAARHYLILRVNGD